LGFLTRLQRGVWLTHSFYRCLVPNPEVKNQQLVLSQRVIANALLNLRSHTLRDFEKAMSNLDKAITNSMYFDFKLKDLKLKVAEEHLYPTSLEQIGYKWLEERDWGTAAFQVRDEAMFHREFSKPLYNLHGPGEILLAKHLLMNFANEPSKVIQREDLVLMRDPREPHELSPKEKAELALGGGSGGLLVRRVVAVPGEEIVCVNNEDETIVLDNNEVWVMADNADVSASDALDSRTFGPVDATAHVFGRVFYSIRSAVDHGPVKNPNPSSQSFDRLWTEDVDIDGFLELYK